MSEQNQPRNRPEDEDRADVVHPGPHSQRGTDGNPLISDAFRFFLKESPQHARAWMTAVRGFGEASALDGKTHTLAYLAVLAALRLERGPSIWW